MKQRDMLLFITVIACFLMTFLNLSGQEINVKKEDGIQIVYNPQDPVRSLGSSFNLVLKQDLVIGIQEKGTDYQFEVISDIKTDDDGNIYIVDEQAHCIKLFDKKGNYLKDIGRKGQGPGEFVAPTEMVVLEDKIAVYSLGRISYFTLDGNFIDHRKVMFGRIVCFDSEGNIIAQQAGRPGNDMKLFLRKFNPEGQILYTVASIAVGSPPSPDKKENAFPKTLLYTVRKDNSVVWTERDKYELNVVDKSGKIYLKIKKDFNPIEFTDEHKKSFLEYTDGTEDQYRFPKYLPPVRYLCGDDKNNIFVCTYEREGADKYVYDVFDEKGRYVEKLTIRGLPMFFKDGYMYCRGEDENNFHQVIRYSIEIGNNLKTQKEDRINILKPEIIKKLIGGQS